jgi:hypothetical protein
MNLGIPHYFFPYFIYFLPATIALMVLLSQPLALACFSSSSKNSACIHDKTCISKEVVDSPTSEDVTNHPKRV